jgi:hypothetical protein
MTTTNEAGENFQEKERAGRTAEDAMRATLARVLRERDEALAELARLRAADEHSCGPTCSREACVRAREQAEAQP